MIRTYLYIILISLIMFGCNSKDSAKNAEQKEKGAATSDDQDLGRKDFQNAIWGLSKSEVKLTEAYDPSGEDESSLIYSRKVLGINALVGYIFANNKLVRGKCMFQSQYASSNDYITYYNKIKTVLEKKYGKARADKIIWNNDYYKGSTKDWGLAVSKGYLVYLSSWDTKKSGISLSLSGTDNKINLWLEYKSKALAGLEK